MAPIVKNQPTASLRVAAPIEFHDNDGQLWSGLSFATASGEVETYTITGGWVAAANDAASLGAGGNYRYQYTQPETNDNTIIGVRLKKIGARFDGGDLVEYFWNPIETASLLDVLDQLAIIAGLLHQNARLDNTFYSANKMLTAGRLRVFASATAENAASDGAPDNADGEIRRFTITAIDNGDGTASSYRMIQVL